MARSLRILTLSGFLSFTILGLFGAFSSAHAVHLVNAGRAQCLTDKGDFTDPRNPLIGDYCTDTLGQEWNWESFGITGIGSNGVQFNCVDVDGGRTAAGTPVQLFPCNGTGAQQWYYFNKQIRNRQSSMCLDISPGGFFQQATIQTCNGSPGQVWSIR